MLDDLDLAWEEQEPSRRRRGGPPSRQARQSKRKQKKQRRRSFALFMSMCSWSASAARSTGASARRWTTRTPDFDSNPATSRST
jgi:hypothetical protein